jgi:hypothetical protein
VLTQICGGLTGVTLSEIDIPQFAESMSDETGPKVGRPTFKVKRPSRSNGRSLSQSTEARVKRGGAPVID